MNIDNSAPLITIGMPVFNDISFIEAALQSLLAQTHSNFKLIISDDGSTDGSADICLKYEAIDSRITYIRQPMNLGISKNMQFLLKECTTEYFMWAADDDLWSPFFIERLISALEKENEAVVAFSDFSDIDENGNVLNTFSDYDYSGKNSFIRLKKLFKNSSDAVGYGIFRREKIENVKFPVWRWPNRKCAYNNIYPTICFYLAKGVYCHVNGDPLFFNRIKTPKLINHQLPYPEGTIQALFAFYLRKLNVVTSSFRMICKADNILLAILILPYLYGFWKFKPSYYQTKHFVKMFLIKKKNGN